MEPNSTWPFLRITQRAKRNRAVFRHGHARPFIETAIANVISAKKTGPNDTGELNTSSPALIQSSSVLSFAGIERNLGLLRS